MARISEWDIEIQGAMRNDDNQQWFAKHRELMYWTAKLAKDKSDWIEAQMMVQQGRIGNCADIADRYKISYFAVSNLIKELMQ